jgi:hypothetical protein
VFPTLENLNGWQRIGVVLALSYLFHSTAMVGQNSIKESDDDVFVHAGVAAHNIEEAITEHITNDPNFQQTKQLPEDRRPFPGVLIKKDGTFSFDWTTGQHARYLMEELRQGIHTLLSVEKHSGLDGIALDGARESWPKVRDISCRESPGIRYYDLDGFEKYCPER